MGNLRPGNYTFGNKTKTEIIALTGSGVTGTGTISASGISLTGSGTQFLTDLYVGAVLLPSSNNTLIVGAITSNTVATLQTAVGASFNSNAYTLLNPNRVKAGDTVFNTTDNYPMYYSGDGLGPSGGTWKKGEFCSGQAVPIRNGNNSTSLLEGNVLTSATTVVAGATAYSSGTVDPAMAVAYSLALGNNCVPAAVCGIHNTDFNGATASKGNFLQPSTTANQASVTDDGAASTGDSCGIAAKNSGTPATEVEMIVNFQERL